MITDHGELWSFFRKLIDQGTAIQQDYAAGRYKSYEEFSSRLDAAARERVREFTSTGDQPSPAPVALNPADDPASYYNPIHQVFFRAGLIACREYMARFVEAESPSIAASIRANWWPQLGPDLGPPRLMRWGELTEGEYGTDSFRPLVKGEVSPTLEALPIALGFLRPADNGAAPDAQPIAAPECPACKGSGEVREWTTHLGPDDYSFDAECPKCGGTGTSTADNGDPAP